MPTDQAMTCHPSDMPVAPTGIGPEGYIAGDVIRFGGNRTLAPHLDFMGAGLFLLMYGGQWLLAELFRPETVRHAFVSLLYTDERRLGLYLCPSAASVDNIRSSAFPVIP